MCNASCVASQVMYAAERAGSPKSTREHLSTEEKHRVAAVPCGAREQRPRRQCDDSDWPLSASGTCTRWM